MIPRALYKLVRDQDRKNPNPVVIQEGEAQTTSKQITDHLLCASCEERFSKWGETEVIRHCLRRNKSFLYHDIIQGWKTAVQTPDFDAYQVPQEFSKLAQMTLYFAASVFWRSAVHRWQYLGGTHEPTSLGKYEKQFRDYLLGKTGFPEKASLFFCVSNSPTPDNLIAMPVSTRGKGWHRHKFHIPGLLFVLLVGNVLPAGAIQLSLSSHQPILYTGDIRRDDWFRKLLNEAGRAKRIGTFASMRQ